MDQRRGVHAVAVAVRHEMDERVYEQYRASRRVDEHDDSGERDTDDVQDGRAQYDSVAGRDAAETGRPTETWRLLAEQLEPRIDGMSHAVDGLKVAPYQVLRADGMQVCDPVNDLRVKVEAVRWMLRIAKHLNGVARELVMGTVSKSVEDLEFVVDMRARALAQRAAA